MPFYHSLYVLLFTIVSLAVHCGSSFAYAHQEEDDFFDLSLNELMAVEVTSVSKKAEKAFDAPAAIFVLTNEEIRRSGAENLPEALRAVPGLQVARINANKWAVSARGFNTQFSNKLLVLIDGRSIYTPLFSGVYWDAQDVPMEDIDRIEVIRGPGATLWGANAVNGVINIVTKHSRETQGAYFSAAAGNHSFRNVEARYGGQFDGGHYRVYAKGNHYGETQLMTNADANDDWHKLQGGFRADWQSDGKNSYTLQGDVYVSEIDATDITPFPVAPFATTTTGDNEINGGNIMGKWDHHLSERSDISLQLYYDRTNRQDVIANQSVDTFDIDFQHNWVANDRHDVTWGVGYRLIMDSLEESVVVNLDKMDLTTDIFSAFLQDKITLIEEELYLTAGTKFEHNDFSGVELQPSARMAWYPSESHTVWASVSRAVHTPDRSTYDMSLALSAIPASPGSLVRVVGNKNLDSEELIAYELGYRVKPDEDLALDMAAFFNDYDKLFALQTITPFLDASSSFLPAHFVIPQHFSNAMEGETYGIELSATWNVTPEWALSSSYSYIDIDLSIDSRGGTVSTDALGNEDSTPNHQAAIRSFLNLPHNVQFDNQLYFTDNIASSSNVQPGDAETYWRFDTRIGWQPMENIEFSIVGQNLLDDWHPEFAGGIFSTQSEIGRTIYGKVVWRF